MKRSYYDNSKPKRQFQKSNILKNPAQKLQKKIIRKKLYHKSQEPQKKYEKKEYKKNPNENVEFEEKGTKKS